MFEPRVELWAGCGLDQLPKSRFFRTMHERRATDAAGESESGFAEGYAKGLSDGAAAQAEVARGQQEVLEALVGRMEAMARLPSGSVQLLLTEAAQRLADGIEAELDVASGSVGELILRLAEAVEAEHAMVAAYLHPYDLEALDGVSLPFAVQTDPGVPRGCVRLKTEAGWIEDGPVLRLRRFRARLDRESGQ